MEAYALPSELRTRAEALGWVFIMGTEDYANAANKINDELTDGQRVLWVDLGNNASRGVAGILQEISYTGAIVLLGKFEADGETESSMDEDTEQKYDRRLLELNQELSDFLTDTICENNLRQISESNSYVINVFDTNLDGVLNQVVIVQTDFD